ncbi:MAG: sigma-70 family RNA polymerase sigma factor [Provencibacterium sp.]|jgi:RNA polymerase sporulation-specific sigma factor|nr:sigma-70 family RNA polymerase sigma factor [Provencibacterium sp.]
MHFRGRRKFAQDVFISDPIDTDKDGNSLSFQDILTDESNIYDEIDLRIKSEQLHRFIAGALEPREREVLYLRYGLHGAKPLTQREVAAKLGISRSYVSRIEKKAVETLKELFGQPAGEA